MRAWMHPVSILSVLVAVAGSPPARAAKPTPVTAPVEKVFVPLGFDDNDNVEVVVHGHFPNTCYKTGPASADVDLAHGVVTLDVQSYLYNGAMCAQVMIPFTQAIRLGAMPPGTYRIEVKDRPGTPSPDLVVVESPTDNPDDYLYAPVAVVDLERDAAGQTSLTITGEYPFFFIGCMVIREVRTYLSPGNTLVVMPISELTDGSDCDPQATSKKFSIVKPLGVVNPDEYLVHVRVLNGESVNRFFDLTR